MTLTDLPDAEYQTERRHALSVSGMKTLLKNPARFMWEREHPREISPTQQTAFDLGHAVHELALGSGPGLVEVKADSWRTRAAQEERDLAREEGKIPLLTDTLTQAKAMAVAVRSHPRARDLLDQPGTPEASFRLTDEETGVDLIGRIDYLPHDDDGVLVDLKTTTDADPDLFGATAYRFGYHMQDAHYADSIATLRDLDDAPTFQFILVETTPPYSVSVCELNRDAREIGRAAVARAIHEYERRTRLDYWEPWDPALPAHLVRLPAWAERLEGQV